MTNLENQLRDALARLMRQLETREWTDAEGNKIADNAAFRDVKTILNSR